MKICFVGPANSSHIVKWCKWFTNRGHDVHVISFVSGEVTGSKVHLINLGVNANGSDFEKLKYLTAGRRIKKLIEQINPDVVNVHYATSYGIAVALSGVKNYVLSVWGADIYDFPKKSPLHRIMLEFSLWRASYLFSTSNAMADEASKYTKKELSITPFGVDMNLFNPNKRSRHENDKESAYIVGTVKGLSDKYGIAEIIKAAAIIKKEGKIPICVRIAGKGPQEEEYHRLAKKLGIEDTITWLGYISQEEAAVEWANMDVAVIPSTLESESFGVSAVEAQACGTAVIITDIPGLMEATLPGVTSLIIPRNDSGELASVLKKLWLEPEERERLGRNGRMYAKKHYSIDVCFSNIELLLSKVAKRS